MKRVLAFMFEPVIVLYLMAWLSVAKQCELEHRIEKIEHWSKGEP